MTKLKLEHYIRTSADDTLTIDPSGPIVLNSDVKVDGSSTFAGDVIFDGLVTLSNDLSVGGENIYRDTSSSVLRLSGGSSTALGLNLAMYGESHATRPNDLLVRSGTTAVLEWDNNASHWDFQGNDVIGVGDITMSGDAVYRSTDASLLSIAGGNAYNAGGNVALYGGSHANAGDISFGSGSLEVLRWDDSLARWDFKSKWLAAVGDITMAGDAIVRDVNDNQFQLSAGNGVGAGANILMYGGNHAIQANDMRFRADTTTWLYWDNNALTATLTGKLTVDGGAKISVMNGNNGGTDHGLYIFDTTDNAWVVYGASASGASPSGGSACTSLDGRTGYHKRSRAFGGTLQGFIWENSSEQCLMSLTADTGDLYTKGGVNVGADIILSGTARRILSNVDDEDILYGSSTTDTTGGAILLRGGSHATEPSDIIINSDGVTKARYDASSSQWNFAGQMLHAAGSAAAPSISISGDPDTGMYHAGTNTIGFATNGSAVFRIQNTGVAGEFFGTAITPFYSWAADDNTGIYRSAENRVAISAGGNLRFEVAETTAAGNAGVWVPGGDDVSLVVGGDSTGLTLTDITNKIGRMGVPHYSNAEEPMALVFGQSTSTENILNIGGGSSIMNSATDVSFWTAATETTVVGAKKWSINGAGAFIGQTSGGSVIKRTDNDYHMTLTAGTATNVGANLVFYGGAHVTNANDIRLRTDAIDRLVWDDSASHWDFQGNDIIGVGGIILNGVSIHQTTNASLTVVSGGSASNTGAALRLYGGAHAQANDFEFQADGVNVLQYDYSNDWWSFAGRSIVDAAELYRASNSSTLSLSGGSSPTSGANFILYGGTHSTNANDIEMYAGTSKIVHYDHSLNTIHLNTASQTRLSLTTAGAHVHHDLQVDGDTTLEGMLNHGSPTELTISSGAITVTKSYHKVDTEGDAASDDLDTINGGTEGDEITLRSVDSSRVVTLKDGTNLKLAGDCVLSSTHDTITLIAISASIWLEKCRSING